MKYRFVVMDKGDPKQGIPPLQAIIDVKDNCKDDNTEEWKKHLLEFYDEEGLDDTTVYTAKELQEMAAKNEKNKKEGK